MKKIKLFNGISIDLAKLIASKLFIYANSGFGKSWLLRWFLEQTFTQIQQIIIDPEGEFSTLREKFDYVLIGKGKDFDIQADPRTAALLAHRLLEEKVSAIIDLFELEPLERERFVANFTTALVNAPKNLWHPYLYVVDEAQDFAPEKGDALSSKPLHSIAKKGRKRGCCPVFATQRVSDFSKAVIAACNNKLIGQASLDIDMKRCAAELGFNTKEQMLSLRDLDPGEFYAYGPAISKTVQKVKIGAVQTTHPDSSKMGAKIGVKVVPASAKVKKALAALADLPQEVEEEANTMKALQEQLRAAKGEITALRKVKEPIPHPVAQVDLTAIKNQVAKRDKEWARVVDGWASYAGRLVGRLMRVGDMIRNELEKEPPKTLPEFIMPTVKSDSVAKTTGNSGDTRDRTPLRASGMTYDKVYSADPVLGKELPEGERKILIAIAGTPAGMSRTELTLLTGYRRSTRNAYIQRLAQKGYVQISGEIVKPTQEGIDALGSDYEPLPVGRDLLEHYLKTLPDGERRVLQVVNDAQTAVSRNYISDVTKYQKSTRNAYIQRLVARKILRIPAPEMVELSESLHD